jgi:hypothetical protein
MYYHWFSNCSANPQLLHNQRGLLRQRGEMRDMPYDFASAYREKSQAGRG